MKIKFKHVFMVCAIVLIGALLLASWQEAIKAWIIQTLESIFDAFI